MTGSYEGGWYPLGPSSAQRSLISPSLLPHSSLSASSPDLSEPEDWGEASPFESRQAPRTKADLLNEIRQRTDRLTGQREAEPDMEETWDLSDPADPLNIGMGWGTGGHGLGL